MSACRPMLGARSNLIRHHSKGRNRTVSKRWSTSPAADPIGSGIQPPLEGLTVLDLTTALAGPSCAMYLADLGANVIKIEVPKKGDDSRNWGPPFITHNKNAKAWTDSVNRQSTYFMSVNRNKRSITLNLKSKKGLQVARKLAEKADVVLENQISGKLAKLGFGYDQVKEINPSIIFASITGYGQTGPYARAPGYDAVVGGEAGIVYATGEPDRAPVRPGIPVTDILTGFSCVKAILAAVINKMKNGKGCYIDVAMFDVQAAAMSNLASAWLNGGVEAVRVGTGHTNLAPYQVFRTKDSYLMIGIGNDVQWQRLCDQMQHPEWKDVEEYKTNHSRVVNKIPLAKMLEADLMLKTSAEWTEMFWDKGFPFGNVNNMQQVFDHPSAKAREIVSEIQHPLIGSYKAVAPPVVYHGKRMEIYKAPPGLGDDNIEILSSLGYSREDIESMKTEGAI